MAMEFEVLCDAVAAEDPGNNGRGKRVIQGHPEIPAQNGQPAIPATEDREVGEVRGNMNQYGDVLVIRPKGAVWGSMETLFHQPTDWPFEEPEIEALFLSLPENHRTLSYPFMVRETLNLREDYPDEEFTDEDVANYEEDAPMLKRSSKRVAFEGLPRPLRDKVRGNSERVPKIAKQMIAAHVKDR